MFSHWACVPSVFSFSCSLYSRKFWLLGVVIGHQSHIHTIYLLRCLSSKNCEIAFTAIKPKSFRNGREVLPSYYKTNSVYKFVLLSIFHSQIFKLVCLLVYWMETLNILCLHKTSKNYNKVIKYFRYCPYADYNLIENKIYICSLYF